jgi:hypothetical protein
MVRRGSPVRVRKRALTKAPQTRGFCFLDALHFVQRARVWNRFWNSQAKRAAILLSSQASERRPRPGFGWVVRITRTRLRKGPGSTWRNHALSGTPPGIVDGLETRRFREGVLPGPGVPSILPNQPAKYREKPGMIRCCASVSVMGRPLSGVSSRVRACKFCPSPSAIRFNTCHAHDALDLDNRAWVRACCTATSTASAWASASSASNRA